MVLIKIIWKAASCYIERENELAGYFENNARLCVLMMIVAKLLKSRWVALAAFL